MKKMNNMDKETALELVSKEGWAYNDLPEELRADKEVALAALDWQRSLPDDEDEEEEEWSILEWVPESVRRDEVFEKEVVLRNIALLRYLPWANREVVLAAMEESPWAFSYAPTELRADREVALQAVRKDGDLLEFVSPELQADREVVYAAVSRDGWMLKFASPELRADRAVVLAAVQQSGQALQYASPELRANKFVVLQAVRSDGWALVFSSPELQADRDIILVAALSAPELLAEYREHPWGEEVNQELTQFLIRNWWE